MTTTAKPAKPSVDSPALAWFFRTVPAFDSLRTYSLDIFRRDAVAGLTVAAVAVPQAMAYASIVGIPAQYGLYTAIVMTAVGALFDSSKQLINGPTNAISIAVLSAIGALALASPEDRIAAAILLALMIGVIQVGITLLRLGDLTRYISHAVIVGFTAGAAVLLVLDQIKNLLGLKGMGDPHDHFLKRLWLTLTEGGSIDPTTLMLGIGTVAFVLGLNLINRSLGWRMPELLLGVIMAATVVSAGKLYEDEVDAAGNVTRKRVAVIGEIPRELPHFAVPETNWQHVRQLSGSALAIALLGLLEAMAMAKAIAARTGQRLDMNQQCLSEGLANATGSFFQCYPGSGSLTRSAINHQAGAVTQWSGVISAIAVAATMVMFGEYARYIPRAALAGILMVSAWRMIDHHKLAYHMRATRMDAAIVLATAIAAVAISVEFCIMIGTFLSFLIYVPRAAKVQLTQLVLTPERVIRERKPTDSPCSRILIYNVEGELFFGSGPDLEKELSRIEDELAPESKVVVLRLKYSRNIDGVCLDLLELFIDRMEARGIIVLFCGVRAEMLKVLRNVGLEERLGANRIYPEAAAVWSSTLDAVRRAYEIIGSDRCAHCPITSPNELTAQGDWYYMI
jgi:SulP family sulfate permease